MSTQNIRILCLGDVVGRPGRSAVTRCLQTVKQRERIDFTIINGENSAGGLGIDATCATELLNAGANMITLGDHTWKKKEFRTYLDKNSNMCIRPANFPEGAPGNGFAICETAKGKVAVMNLIGRLFLNMALDCPFKGADKILSNELKGIKVIVCDMHGEATSEKVAMGLHLDGRVSLVFGTHTHVQTADNRILPKGTGYISDVGMCGSYEGVIGMQRKVAVDRFLSGLPSSYEVDEGKTSLNGVIVEVDVNTGKAVSVERVLEFVSA